MIKRLFAAVAIIWFAGFLWFTVALPGPAATGASQAIIVPTGAAGRIERGLDMLQREDTGLMLVTGVDPEVRPGEFASQFDVSMELMECCVTLGFDAVNTRGNAAETAAWIAQQNVTTLRLVTTDWHMRRASYELRRTVADDILVVEDAVPSEPSLRILFLEYHKLLASRISGLWRG